MAQKRSRKSTSTKTLPDELILTDHGTVLLFSFVAFFLFVIAQCSFCFFFAIEIIIVLRRHQNLSRNAIRKSLVS